MIFQPAHKVVGDAGKPGQLSFDRYPYLKHSTAEPQINTPKKLTFEEWLKTTNITTDDTLLYNWGITVWQAAMAAVPAQPVLDCEIQPRPLPYPLTDYHRAGIDGPLHYTWKDKPHRLLYDLIAAVRYYAAPQAVPVPADMALTDDPWRKLYRRAINEANGLTNYVEDRPELRGAERRLAAIEAEARTLAATFEPTPEKKP